MPINELIDTMSYTHLTEAEFYSKFTLVPNHLSADCEYLFKPDGKELEYINSLKDSKRVWTIWEEDGLMFYTSTVSDYNPCGFLITDEPYTENIRVMLD